MGSPWTKEEEGRDTEGTEKTKSTQIEDNQ
jgi:hypothetical protein